MNEDLGPSGKTYDDECFVCQKTITRYSVVKAITNNSNSLLYINKSDRRPP